MQESTRHQSTLHVVMFPFFAFGHISPFVQLSNKLSTRGVRVTFLSAPNNIPRTRSSLVPHVRVVPLEIPHVPGLPSEVHSTADGAPALAELLKLAIDRMEPQVESLLGILKPHLVIHDFSHQWMGRVGGELGFKTLLFSVFASVSSSLLMVPARNNIKQMIQNGDFDEQQLVNEMKKLPPEFPSTSIKSIPKYLAKDFLYVFKRFGSPSVFDRVMACMTSCDAIIYKSCIEMEGPYIDFIKSQYSKPVLLAGPVVPEPPVGELEDKWASWLGSFPAKSIVFTSFGSETFLTSSQVREVVEGIEMTGLPFMVVLNFQSDHDKEVELMKALPDGFMERVKSRGVVCTGWVQQQQILSHESVGCFVNHAGFSSITEGLVSDCQLVFLPLKGDQFVNAKLMGEDLELGVEVRRDDEDGSFVKEDVYKAVKSVMEEDDEAGRLVRANHEKWRKFLLDKEVHEGYMNNFVKDLKDLAFQTPSQE